MSRDRGTYGPLDRDRHLVIGWGADHLVSYARDRTVGATLRPVLPAIDVATRAGRATNRLWTSTRLMGGRGETEKPLAVVGQELFHTVADRERAIAQISTGFRALANDLAVWQTANKDAPDATATAQWLAADVTPTLEEWRDFARHQGESWWTKIATSWETFEGWWSRLRQLRTLARTHGVALQSVEPVPLPKTIWQRGAEGKGSEATAVLGVVKIAGVAILGFMGLAGIYAVVRDLRPRRRADDREAVREVLREELSRHGAR